MSIIRTVVAGLLAALLGMSVLAAAPAQAEQALPKRTITEKAPGDRQVSFNAFLLKGQVEELQLDGTTYLPYAERTVQLQKKACATQRCSWRTVRKITTNELGKYQTRILAPREGRWKWRVKVKASNGFGTTKGKAWTLLFK